MEAINAEDFLNKKLRKMWSASEVHYLGRCLLSVTVSLNTSKSWVAVLRFKQACCEDVVQRHGFTFDSASDVMEALEHANKLALQMLGIPVTDCTFEKAAADGKMVSKELLMEYDSHHYGTDSEEEIKA